LAGVSLATVSHVVNKTRYVSPALIKKVNDAMIGLDYLPNLVAASLRRKKTGTIGLIVPDISNLFFAFLAKNFEDILSLNNFNIIVSNTSYSIDKETEILNILRSKRVDGIIIVPETVEPQPIDSIIKSGIPVCLIEREIPKGNFDTVVIDNKSAMFEATEYLINLGHKNIGYMDRRVDKSHSLERKKGYLLALEKYNLPVRDEFIFKCGFSSEDGYKTASYFLNRKEKISAILTSGDFAALGLIKCIYNEGLNVPKDISVIGFADIPICPYTIPSLTSIHYPVSEIVKASSDILLSKIENPDLSEVKKIALKTNLIVRDSTSICSL
jgi:DNA-binding LacI/PurR family transcriptional regulator